jgi:hypothetical protein
MKRKTSFAAAEVKVRGERREARREARDKSKKDVRVQGSSKRGGCVAVAGAGASWELAGDGKREREGVRGGLGWAVLGGLGGLGGLTQ